MDAAINRIDASSSFSPFALVKRLVERTQMSNGMLQIRVSVMELGRFTGKGGRATRHTSKLCSCGLHEAMQSRCFRFLFYVETTALGGGCPSLHFRLRYFLAAGLVVAWCAMI